MLTPKQLMVLVDRGVALGPAVDELGSSAVRCLFGPVDSRDAARFAEEHLRADRDRFLRRFGFDILAPGLLQDEEEEDEQGEMEEEGDSRQPAPARDEEDPRVARREQLRNFPYTRQLLITNLWRARRRPTSLQVLKTLRRRAVDDSADTTTSSTAAASSTPRPAPATTF